VKYGTMIAALLVAVATIQGAAQSRQEGHSQGVPVSDVWADPATGLTWSARDNGSDVSWKSAMKYCRDLRLAGHSDWRLASLVELNGIFDKTVEAPGRAGYHDKQRDFTWHVKGNLFLTGLQWANDASGHSVSSYHPYFDFNEGKSNNQPSGFLYSQSAMRGLCVRGTQK
jgi:hypothetical protein